MSRVPTPVEITPQRLNWLADDAVHCEPVSAANSLLNRESAGNFSSFARKLASLSPKIPCGTRINARIPCASEQGIFAHLCREILCISREKPLPTGGHQVLTRGGPLLEPGLRPAFKLPTVSCRSYCALNRAASGRVAVGARRPAEAVDMTSG